MASSDDDIVIIAALLLADEEEQNEARRARPSPARERRRKRMWSRQLLLERPMRGEHRVLMDAEMRVDARSFHGAYRMTPTTFEKLLQLVRPHIEKQATTFRDPIGAAERLGITLRYLGSGMSQKDVARYFCVGTSTICNIIPEVCQALWDVVCPVFLPRPTVDDWKRIAEEFGSRWNFPHCLGAIDGKHIQIQKPALSGSTYFNYKRTFSAVMMAIADASYRFIYLDVGAYGREHDASIFAQSAFGRELENGTLELPEGRNGDLPYVFVGDEAFPLKENLMRPYPGNNLTANKATFNYRLSRARRVVENAFGIMVTKWRILRQPIIANPEKVDKIIKAIGVLHNFLRVEEGLGTDIEVDADAELQDVGGRLGANNYPSAAERVRGLFVDYFNSQQGSLPYQAAIVNRGHP